MARHTVCHRLSLFIFFLFFCSAFLMLNVTGSGAESVCTGKVLSVGLFKNGVVVVREEIDVPSSGQYILNDVPVPLHGTFFIESNAKVSTTSTFRQVDVPLEKVSESGLLDAFAGKKFKVQLREQESFIAELVRIDTDTKTGADYRYSGISSSVYGNSSQSAKIIFKKETGEIVLVPHMQDIVKLESVSGEKSFSVKMRKPVLIFDVQETPQCQGNIKIGLSYLARGLAWAPSYRIDLLNSEKARVEQTALLVNDWRDLANVDFSLISGFPNIKFMNTESLLTPETSLSLFFSSLARSNNLSTGNLSIITNQAVMSNAYNPSSQGNETLPGSMEANNTSDIFYQKIGEQTIEQGARKYLSIAVKETDWEKYIVWNISDNRDQFGRIIPEEQYNRSNIDYGRTISGAVGPNGYQEFQEPCDVLSFRNPFDFPMTTAPALIGENGRFLGQNSIWWSNPGEKVELKITKALSVRATSKEEERELKEGSSATLGNGFLQRIVGNVGAVQNKNGDSRNTPSTPIQDNSGQVKGDDVATAGPSINSLINKKVKILNADYRLAVIDAELSVTNMRKEESNVVVRRRFSGELLKSEKIEGAPNAKVTALADQVNGVNKRHEIDAEFKLAPGETKTIRFAYIVLIRI